MSVESGTPKPRGYLFNETLDVQLDRFVHPPFGFLSCRSGRNAAGQVGRVRRKVVAGILDDNRAMHIYSFKPACLRTLLYVPGARSSDGFPAMVTRPAFVGCLNWR
jgi:hypothetical protein